MFEENELTKSQRNYRRHKEYWVNYRKSHREQIKRLNREYRARCRERDPEGTKQRQREISINYRNKVKTDILNHYSDGTNRCGKCGESRLACLTIDHISGGGTQHRKKLRKKGGESFYQWLRVNSYPKGYQVLCMNCQWIKRVENRESNFVEL